MIAQVEPQLYRSYIITTSKREGGLYVKMQKAAYGLLRSVLLFYLMLCKDLEEFRFLINDHDPHFANKIINNQWDSDDCSMTC